MPHPHLRWLTASVVVLAAAGMSGCTPVDSSPQPAPSATSPEAVASPSVPSAPTDSADALAERDRFMAEQQLPTDGSDLVAVTDAQKEFIAEQRAYVESQGAEWTSQHESVYLALAADACETSILNGHEIDATRFSLHVQSSPLFRALLEGVSADAVAAGEENVASVMVFGTGFLCPEDAPQWDAAFRELYG